MPGFLHIPQRLRELLLSCVRSAPPGGPPADASAVRPRDAREERGTTRWHDGVATARDDVAGETPGALRAEADARREARTTEALGVAVPARVAIVAIVASRARNVVASRYDTHGNTWRTRDLTWR